MNRGEEIIKLKITRTAFEKLYNMGLLDLNSEDYEITLIEPHEVDYPDDPKWKQLKDASIKAWKELKEYEFKKRHS